MKILHVVATMDLAAGGPPRIALRLAAGAASLGHEVTILSYALTSAEVPDVVLPGVVRGVADDRSGLPGAELVSFDLLPTPDRRERLFARAAGKRLDEIVGGFDIVQTHDLWAGISRAAVGVANRRGVKFVVLPNGMLDPWSLKQKWLKKKLMLLAGYRRALDRAIFFHAGNVDEVAGIRAAGFTAPVEIIPNGIYPQEFDPLPEPGRFYAAHPELNGRPFVLFLSRLHYKKGLDYLASAFEKIAARHPAVDLVVAGPDDGAAHDFNAAVRAAGLTDRVHVIGPIFSSARFDALVDAACFCLPSRQEGFSIAILEALACGTPVVITKACHFPEVAAAGAGEVVDLDADSVAGGLDRILSDANAKSPMGAAGRALVMDRYTWPKISQQLVAAYRSHSA